MEIFCSQSTCVSGLYEYKALYKLTLITFLNCWTIRQILWRCYRESVTIRYSCFYVACYYIHFTYRLYCCSCYESCMPVWLACLSKSYQCLILPVYLLHTSIITSQQCDCQLEMQHSSSSQWWKHHKGIASFLLLLMLLPC